tara:strand:- start:10208 stop:15418 length:5211 start_codon:yes stop_codon:yes gene_type:complete
MAAPKTTKKDRRPKFDGSDFDRPARGKYDLDSIEVDRVAFTDAVKSVYEAAAKEDSRPILTGIKLEYDGKEGTLTLAASDGFKLKTATIGAIGPSESQDTVLDAKELLKAVKETEKIPMMYSIDPESEKKAKSRYPELLLDFGFSFNPDKTSIRGFDPAVDPKAPASTKRDDVQVLVQRTPGTYPNFKQLIPDHDSVDAWKVETDGATFDTFANAQEILTKGLINRVRSDIKKNEGKYRLYGAAQSVKEKNHPGISRMLITGDGIIRHAQDAVLVSEEKVTKANSHLLTARDKEYDENLIRGHLVDTGANVFLKGRHVIPLSDQEKNKIAVNEKILSQVAENPNTEDSVVTISGEGTSNAIKFSYSPSSSGVSYTHVAMPMFVQWTEGEHDQIDDGLITHTAAKHELVPSHAIQKDPMYRIKYNEAKGPFANNIGWTGYGNPSREQYKAGDMNYLDWDKKAEWAKEVEGAAKGPDKPPVVDDLDQIYIKEIEDLARKADKLGIEKPDNMETVDDDLKYIAFNAQMLRHYMKEKNTNAAGSHWNALIETYAFVESKLKDGDGEETLRELGYKNATDFNDKMNNLMQLVEDPKIKAYEFFGSDPKTVNKPYRDTRELIDIAFKLDAEKKEKEAGKKGKDKPVMLGTQKLLTDSQLKAIPKLYETDGVPLDEKIIHAKYFSPTTDMTWFAAEYDPEQKLFFGYAGSPLRPMDAEWGYFSVADLQGIKAERDAQWKENTTFKEAWAAQQKLHGVDEKPPEKDEPKVEDKSTTQSVGLTKLNLPWEKHGINVKGAGRIIGADGRQNIAMPDLVKAPGGKDYIEAISTGDVGALDRAIKKLEKHAKSKNMIFIRNAALNPEGFGSDFADMALGQKTKGDGGKETVLVHDLVPSYGAARETRQNLINDAAFNNHRAATWGVLRWMADNPETETRKYKVGKKERELELVGWDWDTDQKARRKTDKWPARKAKYNLWLKQAGIDLYGLTIDTSEANKKFIKLADSHFGKQNSKNRYRNPLNGWGPMSLLMFGYNKNLLQDEANTHNRKDNYDFMPGGDQDDKSVRITRTDYIEKATGTPWGGLIADLHSQKTTGWNGKSTGISTGVHLATPSEKKGRQILGYANNSPRHLRLNQSGLIPFETSIYRLKNVEDAKFPQTVKDLKAGREKWEQNAPRVSRFERMFDPDVTSGMKEVSPYYPRMVSVDVSRQANLVGREESTGKVKPDLNALNRVLSYAWYLLPNQVDVHAMDYKPTDTPLVFLNKQGKTSGNRLTVMGTEQEKEAVKKILQDNFTEKEQKLLKNATISLTPPSGINVAGVYFERGSSDLIEVGPRHMRTSGAETHKRGPYKGEGIDDNTLTHEVIHLLRNRDPERTASAKEQGYHSGQDQDFEEALTDAETLIRMRRNPGISKGAGYHYLVQGAIDPVTWADESKKLRVRFQQMPEADQKKYINRIANNLPEKDRKKFVAKMLKDKKSAVRKLGSGLRTSDEKAFYDRMVLLGRTMDPEHKAHLYSTSADPDRPNEKYKEVSLKALNSKVPEEELKLARTMIDVYLSTDKPLKDNEKFKKLIAQRGYTLKEAEEFAEESLKGKKGKAAINALKNNFAHTTISTLKNKGRAELVDRYFRLEVEDEKGKTIDEIVAHIYDPEADAKNAEVIDAIVPDVIEEGHKVNLIEYKDGKAHKVKIPASARPSRISNAGPMRKTKAPKAKAARRPGKVKSYKVNGKTYSRRGRGSMPKTASAVKK